MLSIVIPENASDFMDEQMQQVNICEIYQQSRIRLMIADDDDVDREQLRRLLKCLQLRFDIIECKSGAEVMEKLTGMHVDCMLLDYHLGDMSGLELLKELADKHDKRIPAIMVTGLGDESIAVQLMHAGAYDYINKRHLNTTVLGNTIESALKRSILEQRLASFQEKIRYMSLHDELTGLANRYQFFTFLEQAILDAQRENERFCVMVLDLDLFKQVNDTMGHAAGDSVLKSLSERFALLIRKSDMVARIGGDEFAIILYGMSALDNITQFCEKIVQSVGRPVLYNNNMLQVGISIGVAIYPQHGKDANTLLHNADHVMYNAKQSARNFAIFDHTTVLADCNCINVNRDLPNALQKKHLFLEYQPKIDLTNNTLQGVEALVRWQSEAGLISPQVFIPTVERTQLIEMLTQFTVIQAFKQYCLWQQESFLIPIAINLSAKMLDKAEFVDWIMMSSQEFNIQTSNVTLEITETALSSSTLRAQSNIARLIAAGFKISIDDFGSGFTSFRYIRDIAISEIKIDQSYIQELEQSPRSHSIVKSMSMLADELSIKIVAEGIEQQGKCDILNSIGAFNGQGFYLARPMDGKNIIPWLKASGYATC